jgi:outer membrane protein OmpA-like peptidoglycan-associated protein
MGGCENINFRKHLIFMSIGVINNFLSVITAFMAASSPINKKFTGFRIFLYFSCLMTTLGACASGNSSQAPPVLPTPNRDLVCRTQFRPFELFSFGIGRDAVSSPYHEILDEIIEEILRVWRIDGGQILVDGHIDLLEFSAGYAGLDLRRADYIARIITEKGIPREFIWTRGRSNSNPLVPNLSRLPEQEQNRRVTITPTNWGRSCDMDLVIRKAVWYTKNCRARLVAASELCVSLIRTFPTRHAATLQTN